MIEIDGKAIPLEPGKHYLLLYAEEMTTEHDLLQLDRFFQNHGIVVHLHPVPYNAPNAVRLIHIEQPETPK